MSNPINAFGIIKRTHKESLEKLNLESSNSIINLQKANRSLTEFINDAPAVEDFYAATESIALIQVCTFEMLCQSHDPTLGICSMFY